MKVFFTLAIFLISGFHMPADLDLKYKFKVGDKFEYSQSTKQTSKQNIPGMGEVNVDALMGGTMLLNVKEVTAQGARIEAQYAKINMSISSAMMNMKMDSEGSTDDPQNKMVKAITGKSFYFNMNNNGAIEKVEGVENIFSDLSSLGLDEATVGNTRKQLQQSLNDQSLKNMLENGLLQYAGKKVKTGDTWSTTSMQTVSFPIKIENTWSVTKVEGNVASLSSDGAISTVDKEKVTNLPNGMKSKSDMAGRQAIIGKVDVASGWPSEVKILSEIKGNMTLLAGGMIPEDMAIPMEITTETTYNITRK